MFGIGGWEWLIIGALALLLFGPDKLPEIARTAGRFMRDFKRYQDLMTSTLRAEMYASDTAGQRDQFEKGKEFRERVAGGDFAPRRNVAPPMATAPAEPAPAEAASEVAPAPEATAPTPADAEGEGERE